MSIPMKRIVLSLLLLVISQTALALDIQSWDTANGVKVLFVESHDTGTFFSCYLNND